MHLVDPQFFSAEGFHPPLPFRVLAPVLLPLTLHPPRLTSEGCERLKDVTVRASRRGDPTRRAEARQAAQSTHATCGRLSVARKSENNM